MSIADQRAPGERKRPQLPPLDLAPTGRLPHLVRTAGKAAGR